MALVDVIQRDAQVLVAAVAQAGRVLPPAIVQRGNDVGSGGDQVAQGSMASRGVFRSEMAIYDVLQP